MSGPARIGSIESGGQAVRSAKATASLLAAVLSGAALASPPEPGRQRELVRLVRQDCGSCHGLTLRGGLGSPLLPETLARRPFEALVAAVLHGHPGTAMPAWESLLQPEEAEWIVARLREGFPEEAR